MGVIIISGFPDGDPLLALSAARGLLVAACGSSGTSATQASPTTGGPAHSSSGSTQATDTAWIVTGQSTVNDSISNAIKAFEGSHPGESVNVDFVANDASKQKIRLAMGTG